MSNNFNFIEPSSSSLDFYFGDTGSSPYYDLDFTEDAYSPSYDFNFGEGFNIYTILKGTSNDFSAIWILNNKMYVSSSDTLTIIDLMTNTVYDWYGQTHIGRANESLDHDEVIDINVV